MESTEGRLSESERLLQELEQAHVNWEIAMEQFNNADGNDVIDDAIYLLLAAEMRYEGLLRVARRMGIGVDTKGRLVRTGAPHRFTPTPPKPQQPSASAPLPPSQADVSPSSAPSDSLPPPQMG